MPAKRTTVIEKRRVAELLKSIEVKIVDLRRNSKLISLHDLDKYRKGLKVAPLQALIIIRTVALELGLVCDWDIEINHNGSDHAGFYDRSFTSSFDLDISATRRSIRDYAGDYLHFALSPDDRTVIVSHCYFLRGAWEDKLPAFRMERSVDGEKRIYYGGYYKNESELFMIGSKKYVPDLRFCVFNAFEHDSRFMKGIMTGVNMKKIIFSTPCCMLLKHSQMSIDWPTGPTSDTEHHYTVEELYRHFPKVSEFLSSFASRNNSCLTIAPTGIDG